MAMTSTKTICFIVTSFWAYGELTIALEFAIRIRKAGYEPVFLIPPSHENILKQNNIHYLTLIPKSRKLNLIIFNEIKTKYDPVAIVLSDFLNYLFCERHYGITVDDLSIFPGKIGTFDIYDFETTRGRVDTYGFYAKSMYNLSLKSYDFLLQPCPVIHFEKRNNKEFRYSLFSQLKTRTEAVKEEARRALGIKQNQKIILTTAAVWQQRYRLYSNTIPFIKACNKMMETVLEMLPEEIKVISVGHQTLFPGEKKKNFTHYNRMLPDEFTKITNAADLFISNNYISTSMLKNTLSGIPTLLIQNSIFRRNGSEKWFKYKHKNIPAILDNCPVVYPFRLFPVGWYSFLQGIVKDNPFYSLMLHSELFTPKIILGKILKLLYEQDMFKIKRNAYLESLKKLPSIEKSFKP
jgi:hypothetical protein